MTYNVFGGTLNLTLPYSTTQCTHLCPERNGIWLLQLLDAGSGFFCLESIYYRFLLVLLSKQADCDPLLVKKSSVNNYIIFQHSDVS